MLGPAANWLAAGLLAFTIFFYIVIYTMWLKRWTAQNIVIGGFAGALPPLIGWAAVTGHVSLEPLLLVLVIFMWTPPHFWALALFTSGDYARAGVPMMPNVAGAASTRRQILVYALLLAPIGMSPCLFGHAGPAYALTAALLGAEFVRRRHSCCGGAATPSATGLRACSAFRSSTFSPSSRCGLPKRWPPPLSGGLNWMTRGGLTPEQAQRRRRRPRWPWAFCSRCWRCSSTCSPSRTGRRS